MLHNPFWSGNFPDPFVLKVRGRYYAYGTEGEMHPIAGTSVFPILTSTDLVHWSFVGKAMPALGEPFFRYWAPEVVEYNGQFLMYYSVHTQEFTSNIRVAVADQPEGPFMDSGHDLTGHLVPWAIDPDVFRDQDGQWYLYMTIEFWNTPEGFTGVGNVVDRLVNPFTLQGDLTQVTPPHHAWQLYERKRAERGGMDWYTVEGPAVIRHRNRYYEMFSGGCYYRDNYAMSYATSDIPMGPAGMADTSWHEWEESKDNKLFIQGDKVHVQSPGHNSFVLGPNNADLYIAYHALQPDMIERRPCLDRLFWRGATPWTAAPTYTPQPAPALPYLREQFESPILRSVWLQQAGHWVVSNGKVIQENAATSRALLGYQQTLSAAWLLEVNLRHNAGDGSYGVFLHCENNASLRVILTPDSQLAVWASDSASEPLQAMPLPDDLVTHAWHRLLISFSGSLLRVQLDYFKPLEMVVKHPPYSFALLTENCTADFSGISLSNHFRDEFLNAEHTPLLLGWYEVQVQGNTQEEHSTTSPRNWHVQEGTLEQISTALEEHIVLKGQSLEQYEFGATMQLHQSNKAGQPAFGLVALQNTGQRLFVWLLQQQFSWKLLVESRLPTVDTATVHRTIDLPETFDPSSWHLIRLLRSDDQLTVYLDGPEVLTLPTPSHAERLGLVTRDTAAAFTGVWQTDYHTSEEG